MHLLPVVYGNIGYPSHIQSRICEVSAHFDKSTLPDGIAHGAFSLHTEYSVKRRKMDNALIQQFPAIIQSQLPSKSSKPKLWVDEVWSEQFAKFISGLLAGKRPRVIEIHPPNSRRCSFERFSEMYKVFSTTLRNEGILSDILMENRRGFRLSGIDDFYAMSREIDSKNHDFKLIVDIPQLLNYEQAKRDKGRLVSVVQSLSGIVHNIGGLHIWGQKGRASHCGDMHDYFNHDERLISAFYESLADALSESQSPLVFVPEINSGGGGKSREDCLAHIVTQFEAVGFQFIAEHT